MCGAGSISHDAPVHCIGKTLLKMSCALFVSLSQLEQYLPELQDDAFVPQYASFLEKTHHNVWIGSSSSSPDGVLLDRAKRPGTVGKLHFDP